MTVIAFDWDPAKAAANDGEHGVTFEEVSTVFADALSLSMPDTTSLYEERWVTIGGAAGRR